MSYSRRRNTFFKDPLWIHRHPFFSLLLCQYVNAHTGHTSTQTSLLLCFQLKHHFQGSSQVCFLRHSLPHLWKVNSALLDMDTLLIPAFHPEYNASLGGSQVCFFSISCQVFVQGLDIAGILQIFAKWGIGWKKMTSLEWKVEWGVEESWKYEKGLLKSQVICVPDKKENFCFHQKFSMK